MTDTREVTQRAKRERERGAALVEAAIVAPVFFLLLFGIFELGLLMRDSLATDNASREGARAAANQANSASADYFVLREVEQGIKALGIERIEYVVVFKATGTNSAMPPGCDTASQAGSCNRYTAADFFAEIDDSGGNDTGNFRCGTLDSSWCPTARQTSAAAGTDFVGVHVQTRHESITGLFDNIDQLGETTIIRLEPSQ